MKKANKIISNVVAATIAASSLSACKTTDFNIPTLSFGGGTSSGNSHEIARDLGFLGETQRRAYSDLADLTCSKEKTLQNYKIDDGSKPVKLEKKLSEETDENKGWFASFTDSISSGFEKGSEVFTSEPKYDVERCKADVMSGLGNAVIEMDKMINYNSRTNNLGTAIPTEDWYLSPTTSNEERMDFAGRVALDMLSLKGINGQNVGYDLFHRNLVSMYGGLAKQQIELNKKIEIRDDVIAVIVDAALIGVAAGLGTSSAVATGSNPAVAVGKQTGTTLGKVIGNVN